MKRVLFDENMPRKLRRDLPEFMIRTAQEEGLAGFKNGALLARATATFDVLVTIDQNLRHQQNVASLTIGVVVIEVPDTRLVHLRPLIPTFERQSKTFDPERSSSSSLGRVCSWSGGSAGYYLRPRFRRAAPCRSKAMTS